MTIDLNKENCMTLAQAAKRLPRVRGSKPPHPLTLYRWATAGLNTKSGQRVYLETEFIGGTRVTSLEALGRFFARKNDSAYRTLAFKAERQRTGLEREAKQAMARLREQGMWD